MLSPNVCLFIRRLLPYLCLDKIKLASCLRGTALIGYLAQDEGLQGGPQSSGGNGHLTWCPYPN